jgi:hypothetical protein
VLTLVITTRPCCSPKERERRELACKGGGGEIWRSNLAIKKHVLEVLIAELLVLSPHVGCDGRHNDVIARSRRGEKRTLLVQQAVYAAGNWKRTTQQSRDEKLTSSNEFMKT